MKRLLLICALLFSCFVFAGEPEDSVYHLISTKGNSRIHGTAFVVKLAGKNVIVTAAHNISDGYSAKVNSVELRTVLIDRQLDLAVLEADCTEFKVLEADFAPIQPGQNVLSISYPEGIFSKVFGRITKIENMSILIAADIPNAFAGSSGSPVFQNGKVIGILTANQGDAKSQAIRGKVYFISISRVLQMILLDKYLEGENVYP